MAIMAWCVLASTYHIGKEDTCVCITISLFGTFIANVFKLIIACIFLFNDVITKCGYKGFKTSENLRMHYDMLKSQKVTKTFA